METKLALKIHKTYVDNKTHNNQFLKDLVLKQLFALPQICFWILDIKMNDWHEWRKVSLDKVRKEKIWLSDRV